MTYDPFNSIRTDAYFPDSRARWCDEGLDILIYAYNFWAPTIVVPLAAAILGFKTTSRRFVAGALAGIGMALLWNNAFHAPYDIDGLVIGCLANFLMFCLIPANRE